MRCSPVAKARIPLLDLKHLALSVHPGTDWAMSPNSMFGVVAPAGRGDWYLEDRTAQPRRPFGETLWGYFAVWAKSGADDTIGWVINSLQRKTAITAT